MQMTFAGDAWYVPDAVDAMMPDMARWQVAAAAVGLQDAGDGNFLNPFTGPPAGWPGIEGEMAVADATHGLPTPENSSPQSQDETTLPALEVVLDLVEVFYERFYKSVPIIHKGKLLSRLKDGGVDGIPSILLYAILTLAAGAHPNPEIRQNQSHWRSLARAALKQLLPTEQHPLETLQAAILLVFEAPLQADYPNTWMMLGQAWRKAAVIGYHQVDAPNANVMVQYLGDVGDLDWIEREECRRVVWMFFIIDRGLCYLIGTVHAVDDRQLVVNFPMSERDFQHGDEAEVDRKTKLKYASDLDRMISRVEEHTKRGACTTLHYVILAYVLLGRVTQVVYAQDAEYDEQRADLEGLVKRLVRIRLLLPSYATDLMAAEAEDFSYVLWLSAMMSVNTIFLHHRTLRNAVGETGNAVDVSRNWPHAVRAARNTVQLLRDGFRSGSGASLILAPVSTALFVCTKVLVMEYMCPGALRAHDGEPPKEGDTGIKADLEVLVAATRSVHSSLSMLRRKFIIGFRFHLQMSKEETRSHMELGARGLLKRCGEWALANDGEHIDIP